MILEMTRQQYIEWHITNCGTRPKDYILDKYYPVREKEEEIIPEPFNPIRCKMKFGQEVYG